MSVSNFLQRAMFCLVFAWGLAFTSRADQIQSTATGASTPNVYSNAANWDPTVVPINSSGNTFNVDLAGQWINLDVDATVNTIAATNNGNLLVTDHSFTASQSSDLPNLILNADTANATVDLGTSARYSPATHTIAGVTYSVTAAPSQSATLKLNGADIYNNTGSISLIGAGAQITDENGNDALRHLSRSAGLIITSRSFTTSGDFTNDGSLGVGSNVGNLQSSTFRVNGDLTNFDKSTRTLSGQYSLYGSTGSAATLIFHDADVVNLSGSISLDYSNQQILDQFGNSALRNLNHITSTGSLSLNRTGLTVNGDFTNDGTLTLGNGSQPLPMFPPFNQPLPMFVINGNLTNLVNGTLTGGTFSLTGGVGLQFNNANIFTNATNLTVASPVIDQGGNSAFRNFNHNLPAANFHLLSGTQTTNADFTNDGTVLVGVAPQGPSLVNQGTFNILGGGVTTNSGSVTIGGGSSILLPAGATYRQMPGGTTTLAYAGTLAAGLVDLRGGSLTGQGTVRGNVTSDAAIAPTGFSNFPRFYGPSPHGTLNIDGSLTLTENAHTAFDIGGTSSGSTYDDLTVTGPVHLGGSLAVSLDITQVFVFTPSDPGSGLISSSFVPAPAYVPTPDDTFTVLTAPSLIGAFDNAPDGSRINDASGFGSFLVSYLPATNGGYQVVLSDFQTPEPIALAPIAAALFGLRRRARRRCDKSK